MATVGKSSERYINHKRLKVLMESAGLKNVKTKNFHYWLPSFLSVEWRIKINKNKLLNNPSIFC
jgi:hypothetical protein